MRDNKITRVTVLTQSLNLEYNNLAQLPPWLGSLNKLKYLNIRAATQGARGNEPVVEFVSALHTRKRRVLLITHP